MDKIILQDIDMVSYPFKTQYTKFLESYFQRNDLATEFSKSQEPYLDWHIKANKENTLFEDLVIKREGGFSAKNITDFHGFLIREFGNSSHFLEGVIQPVQLLNKKLKNKGFIVEGVTARACDVKKFSIYENVKEKTWTWNVNVQASLNEIHYFSSEHKIRAVKNRKVNCMVEDDPYGLVDFLERGVPCVLINTMHGNKHEVLKNELIKKYPKLLDVIDTHDDIHKAIEAQYRYSKTL